MRRAHAYYIENFTKNMLNICIYVTLCLVCQSAWEWIWYLQICVCQTQLNYIHKHVFPNKWVMNYKFILSGLWKPVIDFILDFWQPYKIRLRTCTQLPNHLKLTRHRPLTGSILNDSIFSIFYRKYFFTLLKLFSLCNQLYTVPNISVLSTRLYLYAYLGHI